MSLQTNFSSPCLCGGAANNEKVAFVCLMTGESVHIAHRALLQVTPEKLRSCSQSETPCKLLRGNQSKTVLII